MGFVAMHVTPGNVNSRADDLHFLQTAASRRHSARLLLAIIDRASFGGSFKKVSAITDTSGTGDSTSVVQHSNAWALTVLWRTRLPIRGESNERLPTPGRCQPSSLPLPAALPPPDRVLNSISTLLFQTLGVTATVGVALTLPLTLLLLIVHTILDLALSLTSVANLGQASLFGSGCLPKQWAD